MKFFNNKKQKTIFSALIISLGIFLTGCSNDNASSEVPYPEDTTLDIFTKSDSNNTDSSDITINSYEYENYSDDSITTSTDNHISFTNTHIDINNLPDYIIPATVDRVVDGDTVEIILPSGEEVDTRLLLIDTPETKHPNLGVQKYGPEASEFAKSVLNKGDVVYFELDGKSKTDKYGRYLGYLWYTCDEHNTIEMYNERVIEEGLARVGYIYDQTKHLTALNKTQDIAISKKINIWSIKGYVTDKGYDMSILGEHNEDSNTNDTTTENNNTSSNSSNDIVYANGGSSTSNKYHKASDSHNMKGAIKMTVDEADKNGYVPCSICFK